MLLTSSLAYSTALEFRKNSKFISTSLEESRIIIDERHTPKPPLRRTIDYTNRPSWIETAKDIWNDEIITGVNWLYSINWVRLGEKTERSLNKLVNVAKESSGNLTK